MAPPGRQCDRVRVRRVDPNPRDTLVADSEVSRHTPRRERATSKRGSDRCRESSHRFRVPCRQDPMPAHPGSPRVSHALAGCAPGPDDMERSEEHTSELQSRGHLVCRLLLEKKKNATFIHPERTLPIHSEE